MKIASKAKEGFQQFLSQFEWKDAPEGMGMTIFDWLIILILVLIIRRQTLIKRSVQDTRVWLRGVDRDLSGLNQQVNPPSIAIYPVSKEAE